MLNLPWQGFDRKTFTEIEAHAVMAKRQVRYLAIKQVSQKEKKTGKNNNKSYGE